MGPKVEAACRFVERTGGEAVIGSLPDLEAAAAGRSRNPDHRSARIRSSVVLQQGVRASADGRAEDSDLSSQEMKGSTSPAGEREHEAQLEPASKPVRPLAAAACCAPRRRGDRAAREQLVTSNLGLVRSVAVALPRSGPAVRRSCPGGRARSPGGDRSLRPRPRRVFRDLRPFPDPAGDPQRPHRESAPDPAARSRSSNAGGRSSTPKARLVAAAGRPDADARKSSPPLRACRWRRSRTLARPSVATVSLDEPVLPDGSPARGSVADPRSGRPRAEAARARADEAVGRRTRGSPGAAAADRQLQVGHRRGFDAESGARLRAFALTASHADDRPRCSL